MHLPVMVGLVVKDVRDDNAQRCRRIAPHRSAKPRQIVGDCTHGIGVGPGQDGYIHGRALFTQTTPVGDTISTVFERDANFEITPLDAICSNDPVPL